MSDETPEVRIPHGPHCKCETCADMMAVARSLFARDPELNALDLRPAIRLFVIAIRAENAVHYWGKNTPGKAASPDPDGESPWEQNAVRELEECR